MTVYIFSTSYDIGQIIYDYLSSFDYSCFLCKTEENLFLSVKNLKQKPDLIVLDYMVYNHDLFNIYTYLKEKNIELPIIFFNDPCVLNYTRTKQWMYQLELLVHIITKENRDSYEKLLSKLEALIEMEELSQYISLLSKPKELPSYLKRAPITIEKIKGKQNDYIEEFRKRSKLPNNLFYLLQILQKNKGKPLSLEDIKHIYERDEKSIKKESLKVLISNLKKAILNDQKCQFLISSNRGLYSFVPISEY